MELPARLPKGFGLGDHVVDGWLRDGGMAAIYRAHRSADGRRVAVKLQLPSTLRDPSLGERFEREAELLWRVRGRPHVVELLDVGVLDDGRRYLVMEWVDGEDLEELLDFLRNEDRLLPVVRACRIARDVARGLAALHGLGVVHLDLKPANVMIGRREDDGDHVVLVDFGIAADLCAQRTEREEAGALLGTSAYMSPQRARGEAPHRSCDVYALGVMLFEAVSGGCVPPDGWSPETLPRVDALRRGVPPALAELVHACMRVDASLRPASATVVAWVLDAIIGALEATAGEAAVDAGPRAEEAERTLVMPVIDEQAERTFVLPIVDELAEATAPPVEQTAMPEPTAELEWLEQDAPSWLRWVVAAGVVAVLGGAATWVMDRTMGPDAATVTLATEPTPPPAPIEPSLQPITVEPEPAIQPEPTIQPEPEPTIQPEPAAQPEPAVEPPSPPSLASPAKTARRPRKASPSARACDEARARADAAKRARAWRAVLQATAQHRCWATAALRVARARLRVAAHAELGELEQCVKEGADHHDREIAARTRLCRKKLGGYGTSAPA
jgi:tRNA A-37 threonylcarbamoyl transferase component Bud32